MRATVLVSEYLTYIPAIVLFVRRFSRIEGLHTWETSIALVAILMQPSTILIDHVHFQYNTVMLGFFVASISSLLASRYLWASVFFVGALGFKQMALYYAPAVFAYLLGCCVFPRVNVIRLLGIATITLLSFVILFAPLLLGSLYDKYREIEPAGAKHTPQALHKLLVSFPVIDTLIHGHPRWWDPTLVQLDQAIYRIFPFARGLFEDKVANIWCALNVIIKLKKHSIATLQRLSLLATLIAITPPCFLLFLRPKHDMLLPALASTAWGFFLCSFQVHEKSVLLPLLPMTLMLASRTGLTPPIRAWVGWANLLAVWTMFPLLKRVELRIPYAVLSLLWAYLLGIPPASLSVYLSPSSSSSSSAAASNAGEVRLPAKILQLSFYIAMLAWHIIEEFAVPPASKPDLWVIANVGIGAAGFCICYLWCLWQCVLASGLVSKASSGSNNPPKLKPKTL
jgi:alpha-1,3-glucosyltransferase